MLTVDMIPSWTVLDKQLHDREEERIEFMRTFERAFYQHVTLYTVKHHKLWLYNSQLP